MISIIAAIAPHNIIGAKNEMPWYLPEDLKHFKEITTGHTVLMGRKTYDNVMSHLHKPLPNRKNIVISSQQLDVPPEVEVYSSIEKALENHKEDVFIMGGASIFKETINMADKLYITEIKKEYQGDVYFPEIDTEIWTEIKREDHEGYSFVEYEKK